MDEKTIKCLVEPFPESALKKRAGARKQLIYVEGAVVVERLNKAFDHGWTWEIIEYFVDEAPNDRNGNPQHDVTVRGRLTVYPEGIIKEAFGGVRVGAAGKGECRGDDLKGASTDALKKAASLLGVGLHLYSDEIDTGEPHDEVSAVRSTTQSSPQTQSMDVVSEAQLKAITAISRQLSMKPEQVVQMCKTTWKKAGPRELSKKQASELISQLKEAAHYAGGEKKAG